MQTRQNRHRATRDRITLLKKRRDRLLNTAGTLQERQLILQEVRAINREIQALQAQLFEG